MTTDRTPIEFLDPEALAAGNYLLSVTGTGAAKKFTVVADTGAPSGPAGGSLAGTYPNPTLAAGAVNSAEINAAIKDAAAATASLRTLGTGATQAAAGNHVHAAAGITVQDENANVATGVTQIDFQGAGVSATAGTGEVVVTIAGGGTSGDIDGGTWDTVYSDFIDGGTF